MLNLLVVLIFRDTGSGYYGSSSNRYGYKKVDGTAPVAFEMSDENHKTVNRTEPVDFELSDDNELSPDNYNCENSGGFLRSGAITTKKQNLQANRSFAGRVSHRTGRVSHRKRPLFVLLYYCIIVL